MEEEVSRQAAGPPRQSQRRRLIAAALVVVVVACVATVLGLLIHKPNHGPSTKQAPDSPVRTQADAGSTQVSASPQAAAALPGDKVVPETGGTPAAKPQAGDSAVNTNKPAAAVAAVTAVAEAAAAAVASDSNASKQSALLSEDGQTCYVADADELTIAIQDMACPVVQLTGTAEYLVDEMITIDRDVVIQGNPVTLPQIDGNDAERTFLVKSGAYVEVRYVRLVGAGGRLYDRYTNETVDDADIPSRPIGSLIRIIEGGSFYFESGNRGGRFVGVFFVEERDPVEGATEALTQMEYLVSERVYGGHLFINDGEIDFIGCTFFDTELLTSIWDRWIFGGDFLMLGGQVTMTACHWFFVTILGGDYGAGQNGLVLGGNLLVQAGDMEDFNFLVQSVGPGDTFFVGAGTMVLTAFAYNSAQAAEQFTGAGAFMVSAGAMILTGVSFLDIYGLAAAMGVGLDYVTGAGIMVVTGSTINQFNGPFFDAMAGGLIFVGGGLCLVNAFPVVGWESFGYDTGAGTTLFNAGGILHYNWCPIFSGFAFYGSSTIGEYYYLGGGETIMLGSPSITFGAMDFFTGQGNTHWQGGGAMILGYTAIFSAVALLENMSPDFWVEGSCEPKVTAWEPDNPIYVYGAMGCNFYSDPIFYNSRLLEGGEEAVEVEQPQQQQYEPSWKRRQQGHRHTTTSAPLAFDGRNNLTFFGFESPVTKVTSSNDTKAIEALPESMQSLARDILAKVFELKDALNIPTTQEASSAATVHIAKPLGGSYCGTCGMNASVDGPGADSCMTQDSCDDMVPPPGTEDLFNLMQGGGGGPVFTDQYMVLATLNPTTSYANRNLSEADLRTAVVDAIEESGATTDDVKVTVFSTEVDPLFAHHQPPKKRSLFVTDDFGLTHYFKVIMLTQSMEDAQALVDAVMGSTGAEPVGGLADTIKAALLYTTGMELGHVGLEYDRTINVPAYKSKRVLHENPIRSFGLLSVLLSDPERPAIPVDHVEHGREYDLLIDQFRPNADVSLQLISHPSGAKEGPSARTLQTVTTDAQGKAELKHVFGLSHHPTGDYYIKAVDLSSGAFGLSPVYWLVEGRPRPRKLCGPDWWI